jgi:hypothetical protein
VSGMKKWWVKGGLNCKGWWVGCVDGKGLGNGSCCGIICICLLSTAPLFMNVSD